MKFPKKTFAKNSLFIKIFTINLLIILIAFMVISVICYTRINSYLRTEHVSSILSASSRVYDLSKRTEAILSEIDTMQLQDENNTSYYKRFKDKIAENYRNSLAVIASSSDFSVMQIAPDNQILFRFADINSFKSDVVYTKPSGKPFSEYLNSPPFISGMFEGKIPPSISTVNYNGEEYYVYWGNMEDMFKVTTLAVIKPLYNGESISSMLMLFIPTPQIKHLLNVLASIFILAALISLLISVGLTYILTYRISKPLKDMNEAAMKLASGDFSKRVNTDGNNIGEIRELITTFNDMAESIENSEENQRAFTASIAHELRTPMTSIIGFIDSILDGTIPEENAHDYLKICLSEARRLSRLITELMDVARVENGNTKLEMTPFDINECIRRQIIKYQDPIADKNLNVDVEFETEECFCLCDRDSVTRVIINLIDNAIKFTPSEGFIKFKVYTHSGKAHISIENSGEGISENDLKHIFDKFYKTDKSRSLDKKGVGLGLYLAKNILSLHGENISAESIEGEFTRFIFTLKLTKNYK